jgi:hypothetical protein
MTTAALKLAKSLPKDRLVPLSQGQLLKLVDGYCSLENVAPSRFGRDVMNDPTFMTRDNWRSVNWHAKTRLRLTQFFIEKGYLKRG